MTIVGTKLIMSDGFAIDLKAEVFVPNYKHDPGFRPLWEPGNPVLFPGSRVASAVDMAYRSARKKQLGKFWLYEYIPELGDNWKKIIAFVDVNGVAWAGELKELYPVLKTNLKTTGAAIDKIDKQRLKTKGKN